MVDLKLQDINYIQVYIADITGQLFFSSAFYNKIISSWILY
jgi:hypothetical protein